MRKLAGRPIHRDDSILAISFTVCQSICMSSPPSLTKALRHCLPTYRANRFVLAWIRGEHSSCSRFTPPQRRQATRRTSMARKTRRSPQGRTKRVRRSYQVRCARPHEPQTVSFARRVSVMTRACGSPNPLRMVRGGTMPGTGMHHGVPEPGVEKPCTNFDPRFTPSNFLFLL